LFPKLGEIEMDYPLFETRITRITTTADRNNTKTRRRRAPSHTRFGGVAVSAILILSSLLLATQNSQNAWAGTFPGPNGQIAFAKEISGQDPDTTEIYVMDPDSGEQTQLTDNDVIDTTPSWSPDGEKIAFARGGDEGGIYVMNADGSDETRLTTDGLYPSWSPDGEKIAFASERDEDGNSEIYVMNADDGSDVTRLTDSDGRDTTPSWSPDGEKIAFASERDEEGNLGIYVMNADDGSDVTRLTTDGSDPSWSPDGEKIAFTNSRSIYVMNADDGSDVTRLTTDGRSPSWSPDGEKIAFTSIRDLDEQTEHTVIYVMNADDGSDVTRLTDPPNARYSELDWGTNTSSPDGDDHKDKKHDH
jgi:Tol biopolymer transport system component